VEKVKTRTQATLAFSFLLFGLLLASSSQAGEINGKVTVQRIRSAGNIAVYIDAIPGKDFTPPEKHAVEDQKHMAFVPHVLVVLKGTTVDFLNSDPVGHNVYWPNISGNKKLAHNLGTWPQGQTKSFTFNDLGAAPLLCNVHPEMAGYIVVVPTPYFATTNSQGEFEIKDVPPGSYTLKTWSEEGKPSTQSVTVSGESTSVNITVSK
jgi:plastocyanin